jgi:hypothetical protein
VHAAVSEIELFKNWVFFPRSEHFLFILLILLNIVKNTCPMRKVMGNELEVYLYSFKLRFDGQLQVQCFSQKWQITENLERWNLGKINEIVYCYISEERDALLNENDNWITSDSELI